MPTSSSLRIDTVDAGLVVSGVVDAHTAPQLAEALAAVADAERIVLDLGAVDFIDSSGLRVLVDGHQRYASTGATLVLSPVSEAVTRLLELAGLVDHLVVE